jgi:uncharacterized membrane protein
MGRHFSGAGGMKSRLVLLTVGAVCYFCSATVGHADNVLVPTVWIGTTPIALGTPYDGMPYSLGLAINDLGQTAGVSFPPNSNSIATFWNNTTPSLRQPVSGAVGSYVNGINNSGQLAGYSIGSTGTPSGLLATIWNGSKPTALGVLPNTYGSYAMGINDAGQVAGFTNLGNGNTARATIWNNLAPTILPPLPGGNSSLAIGINNIGQVVGTSIVTNSGVNSSIATIWNGTTPIALGILPGAAFSNGEGINDLGEVVGSTYFTNPQYTTDGRSTNEYATIWNGLTPTELGMLQGGVNSDATSINNLGEVAGATYFADGSRHATIWNGLTPTDLGTLPGMADSYAFGINNLGEVVGYSSFNAPPVAGGVPEPSTWAMMILGFLGLGWMAYRRKNSGLRFA